jgi:hypothetical protein
VTLSDTSDTASLLFVFDAADRLSDRQIEEICGYIHEGAGESTAAVLLVSAKFLARLQDPPMGAFREVAAVRLRFDEIGDDEGIDFLRHQLAARQREDEARQGRPILLRGVTVVGVLLALAAASFFIVHYVQLPALTTPSAPSTPRADNAPTNVAPQPTPTQPSVPPVKALPPSTDAPNTPAPPASQAPASPQPPASSQPQKMAEPTASFPAPSGTPDTAGSPATPRSAQPEPERHLSSAEIAVLVARGDAFLSAGDIASARLFYERAADAGSGDAALRLGATFDPNFLGRAGVRGNQGDPAQAESWYRRARDFGDAGAAERLKTLGQQPR